MDFHVRAAEEDDRRRLALLFAAVAEERDGIAAEPPVDIEKRAASWDVERILVAVTGRDPVGLIFVHESPFGFGDIGMLVAAEWRGRGVGTALVAAAIEWARARGLHKLTLDVFPHNDAAIVLYRKFGFVEEGRRVKQIRRANGDLWDVISMGLPLKAHRMAAVRELQRGLWWWEAVHPEWTAEDDAAGRDWGPEVSSYAIDDGTRLLLIDPTTPPEPVVEAAVEREVIIVLTNPWHERDAPSLAERFGAQVYAPPPDDGGRGIRMPAQLFSAGDRLPFGVDVFPGREPPYDLLLWVESHGAVAIGDTLIDRGDGIELLDSWLPDEVTRVQVVDGLRPLLALPIEHVLPTHGPPTDRAALERALA